MMKLNIQLQNEELEDFEELLYGIIYSELPHLDSQIAELILKRIEENKDD